jgi:gliding motility-associated-like protein
MVNKTLRNWQVLTTLFTLLFAPFFSRGQDIKPGDLAVLGINAHNPACSGLNSEDQYSFVCFKDIVAGTVLDLTDNGWERVNPGLFGDTEGTLRMTFNSTIPKGEVITISSINNNPGESYSCVSHPPGTIDFVNINVPSGNAMNMNSGGDQLFFMQGGTWNSGPGTHDASYTGGNILFGFSTSDWDVSSGTSQESHLHPDVASCFHMEPTIGQTDYLKYTGPMTAATQLDWIERIKNPANWTPFANCAAYNSAAPNYPQPIVLQILPNDMSISCLANCGGCAPLSSTLTITLPGTGGPFDVVYTNGSQQFSLNNISDGHTVTVTVNSTTTFSLISVTDALGCPVYSNFNGEATLTVATPPVLNGVTSNSPICAGENLQLTAPFIPNVTYSWTGPNNFKSTQQNPAISNASVILSGTYTLVVSNNGCNSQPATVNVTVLPKPVAQSTTLTGCGINGSATFDLTSADATVNNNTGNPVNWYNDPFGNNPVNNPGAFVSAATTVYAEVVNNNNCRSALVPVTLNVTSAITPNITGIPGVVCQNAAPLNLPTTQSGISGQWLGTNVSNNTFNPAGQSGTVTLTFLPSQGACANPATYDIVVNVPVSPTITGVPASVCQLASPVALPTTQGGFSGTWSGQGVNINSFNPAGLSGNVTLTFTPTAGQCAQNAPATIAIQAPTTPAVTGVPASVCQSASPVSLPASLGGITGNWSGTGVTGNNFNPAGQSGSVTLTFTPTAGQCANGLTTAVIVTVPVTPQPGTATLCQTAAPLNLNTLNDPAYPAGTWSGTGVTNNSFNPAGLSGNIPLTFTATAACTSPATTNITVNIPAIPQLGTAGVCQNDSPLSLNTLVDPAYPAGTWSGTGVTGNTFNPAGLSNNITLIFTPSAACTQPGTTTVKVNTVPVFTGLVEACNQATQTYVVSFTINSGNAPYTVNGNPVAGTTFTSSSIASGTTYSFVIDDANGCGPVTVSGSANCACTTNAGTMNLTGSPLVLCYNASTISVPFNGNQSLDANDVLQFVLHDNPGATLGTVIATSNTATFNTPPGLVMGKTYYVSAIAGNNDGSGKVNLTDPCLSVSQGMAVQFYQPGVQLSADATVCANECTDIGFQFTGKAPFSVNYRIFQNNTLMLSAFATNLNADSVLVFCPASLLITNGNLRVDLPSITDGNQCTVFFTPPNEPYLNMKVTNAVTNNLSPTLCAGESVVVNGKVYDTNKPSGTEVFTGGSFSGCDSVVNVNLSFRPPVSYNLNQTLCPGGSITVNGNVYNAAKPTGTEILKNASVNGCDSTVYINLTFSSAVVTNLNPTLCPGESLTVKGQVYNAAKPAGTEIFPGGSYLGCDSIVQISLSFRPAAIFNLNQTLCTGGSVTVNGKVYSESKPSGTEVIPNGSTNGCDSTIYVNLSFNSVVVENITQTLCPGESITVKGKVYNQANPSGTETFTGGSYLGCDSLVNINLTYTSAASFNLKQTLCPGESITVNGTVYNQAKPSGTELLKNASVNGCDSTVIVQLSFFPTAMGNFTQKLCAGESITINGQVFNQANPTGMIPIPQGSFTGCDSTVNVNLTFFPSAVNNLDDQLCTGGSITVNGTVYNEANPSGTEMLPNASIHGCDSTVVINLKFGQEVIVNYDPIVCPGESIFINGTLYFIGKTTGTETIPGGSYQGCDSIINVNLSFYPDAVGTLNLTLPSGSSIVLNGTAYNQQKPAGIEVLDGGSYAGCDSTVFINLNFTGVTEALAIINSPLCPFGQDGSIEITSIGGGTPPYQLALNGSNSTQVTTFPVVFDSLDAGFHTLTIVDDLGNISQQELYMPDPPTLYIDLGDERTVPLGSSIQLASAASFVPVYWSWTPPDYLDCTDCPEPTVQQPMKDILYTLEATDANGCVATAGVSIIVEKIRQLYVPSAFSPNGDGINDELTVYAGQQVAKINTMKLFNRWGAVLFERNDFKPNDQQLGWDGTFKGLKVDVGTYTWFAEVEFLDGHVELFEGGVTVIR